MLCNEGGLRILYISVWHLGTEISQMMTNDVILHFLIFCSETLSENALFRPNIYIYSDFFFKAS